VSASSNNNTLIDSIKRVVRRKVSSDREGNSKSTVNISHINFHKLMILYDMISQSISASILSELFQCHYSRAKLLHFHLRAQYLMTEYYIYILSDRIRHCQILHLLWHIMIMFSQIML
jgi:hypothetical protein